MAFKNTLSLGEYKAQYNIEKLRMQSFSSNGRRFCFLTLDNGRRAAVKEDAIPAYLGKDYDSLFISEIVDATGKIADLLCIHKDDQGVETECEW